ncbi:peptidase domain-containing ABC transporter [Dyadobacter crusticola]|uniref:peptidase domain-containing ABC transporter n=1 Tax=Dyadobacter crusticola TaxID=292407 RepID=UPI0004E267DB|nr:peptidase domain-containing ABC transporter [Dyadobacter crusticola]
MNGKFSCYRQLDQMDCGPTCLRMVAKYYGMHYTAQTLREKANISRDGVSMLGIAEAAESLGFKTLGVKISIGRLIKEAPLPCILHWGQNHFVVLTGVKKRQAVLGKGMLDAIRGGRNVPRDLNEFASEGFGTFGMHEQRFTNNETESRISKKAVFTVADPASGMVSYSQEEFELKWLSTRGSTDKEGVVLLLEPTPRFYQEEEEKGRGLQLQELISYLWRYKRLVFQLALGMAIGTGLSVLLPFLTQSVIDVGIGTRNLPFIYIILIAQLVLMFSMSAVDFLRSWILLHISVRLNLTILAEFLSKLMRLPVAFFDAKQFGDIMQRIGDHHRIESFLTGQTLGTFFSLFNLAIFGVILAWYNITIFILAICTSILYALWVILFLRIRRKLDTKRFEISSKNQSKIVQLIQGMQDIKLAGAETLKRWEWERIQVQLFKWNIRNLSLSQIQQAGTVLINNGKNVFITFLAAKAVLDGELTLGGMVSIQYILGQFNAPIEQLISFLQAWQDAQMSVERLNEIHALDDEEPENIQTRSTWDHKRHISVEKLSYAYPGAGNEPVLKNITLDIWSGKTTAIVGTSGSGKTTLLKLLLRFYEPVHGKILLSNKQTFDSGDCPFPLTSERNMSIKSISHKAWRSQCGVVMQDGFIFSDTIARNIAVHEEVIQQEKLFHAARTANIHTYVESLPLGYHTRIGAEGNGISQGQKQRILIARAVYKDPQLLLFDEATNALDANNEAIIMQNLKEFFVGKTVVVVAHRLSTVKHADQIVVLDKGEVVEVGTHRDLVALQGKYFELVSNQLELAEG